MNIREEQNEESGESLGKRWERRAMLTDCLPIGFEVLLLASRGEPGGCC